jgi:hypothetical protein
MSPAMSSMTIDVGAAKLGTAATAARLVKWTVPKLARGKMAPVAESVGASSIHSTDVLGAWYWTWMGPDVSPLVESVTEIDHVPTEIS